MNKVLEKGQYRVGKTAMFLHRWCPGLDLDELLLSTWVVWYEMSGVPEELYNAWGLKSLVLMVGKFIAFDNQTRALSRPTSVRACCEINARRKLPEEIKVKLKLRGKEQVIPIKITYENLPMICSNCDQFGHSMEKCRSKSNEGDVLVPAGERSDCSLPGKNLVEKMGCSNNENGVSEEEENEQRYMQVERYFANENVRVSGGPKRGCKEIFQHIE